MLKDKNSFLLSTFSFVNCPSVDTPKVQQSNKTPSSVITKKFKKPFSQDESLATKLKKMILAPRYLPRIPCLSALQNELSCTFCHAH